MLRLFYFSFSILVLFIFVSNISTQQWTEAQKDVWGEVEKYWEAGISADPTDFLSALTLPITAGVMKVKHPPRKMD